MWHIRIILITMAGVLLILAPKAHADGLQLKNGNFVQGKYLGGNERAVRFEVNGRIHLYDIGEILSINFGSADGSMPSSSVEPKASANTELRFTAGGKVGSKPGKAAEPIAWRQESSCVGKTPNFARRTQGSENPGEVKGILRPRFALISD